MQSKASIKKEVRNAILPEPKLKPTKPVRTNTLYTREGGFAKLDKSPLREMVTKTPTEQNQKNAQESRRKGYENNEKKVLAMALLGKPDSEIAARTGYKESSVRRIITKLRSEGHDIPQRERGRKCKEQSE